jgi:hypothetical protein
VFEPHHQEAAAERLRERHSAAPSMAWA